MLRTGLWSGFFSNLLTVACSALEKRDE